jgi:rusticyanin
MLGILALLAIVLLVPIGYFLTQNIIYANGPNGPGCTCFDGNPYVPNPVYNGTSMISGDAANATARHLPAVVLKNVDVDRKSDTITFHSMNITLIVFSNSNSWVSALTHMPIPAYDNQSISNAFDIDGLYLPSLVIPRGATINVTFINMDPLDHHNFVISTLPPPYDEYIMQSMNVGGSMVAMTPLLSPFNTATNTASEFQYNVVLQTNATHMWYMCMFPDHAMLGMYGNITLS